MRKTNSNLCLQCKKPLPTIMVEKGYHYCSRACLDAKPIRKLELRAGSLPRGTVVLLAQLAVEMDLWQRGFHVYASKSPSTPCDFIVTKAAQAFSICVRCAYTRKSGTVFCNRSASDACDTYAMVTSDLEVTYDPPLPA